MQTDFNVGGPADQRDFILLDRSQSMSSQWGEAMAAVHGVSGKG